jgi:hypothetical protein
MGVKLVTAETDMPNTETMTSSEHEVPVKHVFYLNTIGGQFQITSAISSFI